MKVIFLLFIFRPDSVVVGPINSALYYSGLKPAGEPEANIRVLCATQKSPNPREIFMNQPAKGNFNSSKPLVLFIHGFIESYLNMPSENYIPPALKSKAFNIHFFFIYSKCETGDLCCFLLGVHL